MQHEMVLNWWWSVERSISGINVRFMKKWAGVVRYQLDVFSHRVTLNLELRQGPNRGKRYQPEVHVSLTEYGISGTVL